MFLSLSKDGACTQFFGSYENLPEEGTVKAHIRSLRQKLKAVGAPDDLIQTARGLGYCLKQLSPKKILSPESTR